MRAGITYPSRARSLVIDGCGYGAAQLFEAKGVETARQYAIGPTRVQYQNKDPRGWTEFAQQLTEHDWQGRASTMRGVQMERPSLWELTEEMKKVTLPTLVITGDEDDPCLESALLLKRSIPAAGLVVLPQAGHTINLEDPEPFNRALLDFFTRIDGGRWAARDARSTAAGILGFRK